ncbi:hypothetical protein FRC17_006221 [Serendipita sp. 399]|nr:hypothetical protein FRC17_006221 [Serendipita sp. 399]
MALTLISLAIFATSSIGSPVPQALPDVPGIVEVVNNLMGTPSGVPASQTTTSTQHCAARYTSQEYDTCASIGQPWGLSGNDILSANTFLNCADIWPGTPICIPSIQPTVTTLSVVPVPRCQQTYTSVEKDTCDSIGTHFGVSGNDIYQANTFLNCNDICRSLPPIREHEI